MNAEIHVSMPAINVEHNARIGVIDECGVVVSRNTQPDSEKSFSGCVEKTLVHRWLIEFLTSRQKRRLLFTVLNKTSLHLRMCKPSLEIEILSGFCSSNTDEIFQ